VGAAACGINANEAKEKTMYAQLVYATTKPEMRPAADALVCRELIPALREEPGFAGTLNLVDAETGDGITIVLWETAEQARRPLHQYGPRLREALGDVVAVLTQVRRLSIWEVNARA
jgi:hypothetical protein